MINKQVLGLSFVFFLLSVGSFLVTPEILDLCQEGEISCISNFEQNVIFPIFSWSVTLFLITVFLSFLSVNIFKVWLKFTVVYLLFSVIVILVAPSYCDAPFGPCWGKELATWLSVGTFVLISLLIIIYKKIKEVRQKNALGGSQG